MLKNKKADVTTITPEFALRLGFALFCAIVIVLAIISYFIVKSLGELSFDKLVGLIKETEEGETLSMDLRMDKGTALIGFTSDANEVRCKDFLNPVNSFLKRPDSCEKNTAYICLCESGLKKVGTEYYDEEGRKEGFIKQEYECKKLKCVPLEYEELIEPIDEDNFGSYLDGIDKIRERNYYQLEGGFIHTNEKISHLPGIPVKETTVYTQRYKGTISVCFTDHCIPEATKNQRLDVTFDEASEADFKFVKGYMFGIDTGGNDIIETFYYIVDLKKDLFGDYYYHYKYGIRPESTPEQASFLDAVQEKTKQDFEVKIFNYAQTGRLVQIDYDNKEANIKSFDPEVRLDNEGNIKVITAT